MKFIRQVYIGSDLRETSDHSLVFNKLSPGTASLKIKGDADVNAIVAAEIGWDNDIHRCFTGIIERVAPAESGYSMIFCRELSAVLYNIFNFAIRQPTLIQLLNEMTARTGLQFVVPDVDYQTRRIPKFYSIGNGYNAMDMIGAAFGINDYIWQQQGNGHIFVGSWHDSHWADKPISLPNNLFTPISAKKSSIACIPSLKPHVVLNGARLATVEHTETKTILTWI